MDATVFQSIGGTVQNAADTFLAPVTGLIVTTISGAVAAGVTLYVFVVGLLIVLGYVERPLGAFTSKSLRIIIVTGVALSVDVYGSAAADGVRELEAMFASALNVSGTSATNVYQVLDRSLGAGLDLTARCFEAADNASWRAYGSILGWLAAGLIIALGSVVLTLLGGAVIIVAKFALAMLVAVGPLFIVCLIWPPLARFFDQWMTQIFNYALVAALVVLMVSFSTVTFVGSVNKVSLDGTTSPIIVAFELLVISGLLTWLMYQVQTWAAALSGGMSTSVMTFRHMAAPGRALSSAASGARNIVDPRSTRRDLESGHMVTARRGNHLIAGNSVANPAYRQHVIAQAGKNWSRARGGKVNGG